MNLFHYALVLATAWFFYIWKTWRQTNALQADVLKGEAYMRRQMSKLRIWKVFYETYTDEQLVETLNKALAELEPGVISPTYEKHASLTAVVLERGLLPSLDSDLVQKHTDLTMEDLLCTVDVHGVSL